MGANEKYTENEQVNKNPVSLAKRYFQKMNAFISPLFSVDTV